MKFIDGGTICCGGGGRRLGEDSFGVLGEVGDSEELEEELMIGSSVFSGKMEDV
jgi:hypothetical protein